MSDPAPLAALPQHPAICGISLAQYAAILSGLEDELDREALFAYAAVSASEWESIHEAWQRAVLADLAAGGELAAELAETMAKALLCWSRPLPPVDQDLGAWLDLWRAWSSELEPAGFLSDLGLRACDICRLHALWMGRFETDPALRRQAAARLAEPEGPVPEIHPSPACLPSRASEEPTP